MTIKDVLTAFALAGCIAFLAYKVGELRGKAEGRKLGYAICVSESDDDYPRTYSERVGPVPEERL